MWGIGLKKKLRADMGLKVGGGDIDGYGRINGIRIE